MVNAFIKKMTLRLIAYCERKEKVFIINGVNASGGIDAYLIRYLLVNTKYFNFYIHRFLRSDHDVPHDHPWHFITYIVDGEYNEERFVPLIESDKGSVDFFTELNKRKKGSLVFRRATDVHKVLVKKTTELADKEQAPLTLCITGPRFRVWGFWKGYFNMKVGNSTYQTNSKFIKWTEYLGIEDDSAKRG